MKTKTTRATLALLLTALAVALAACGGSDDASSGGAGMSNTPGMDHGGGGAASRQAGAVDRAFVAEMIPHHQMAVEMAQTAREQSDRGEITQLADSIVSTQTTEVAALRGAAKRLGVKPAPMPTGGMAMHDGAMGAHAKTLGLSMDEMGMSMDMEALADARPFDRAFIDDMVPHHQGAIRMARAELSDGTNAQLKRIARSIIAAQTKEIRQMNSWRTDWYGADSPAGGVPQA